MKRTEKLVLSAVLSALAVALIYFVHFPVFPAAPFLEYDPGDIPIFLGAALLGAPAGILITLVSCIVQGLTVSAQSGIWGIVMHFLSTGTFVAVFSLILKKSNSKIRLIVSLISGALAMTAVMAGCNLIITPLFLGTPIKAVLDMMIPIIIPFNLIKSGINALATFVFYMAILPIFRRNIL